ncbi:hypothetical protein ACQP3L_36755, partial [Escherichia coli]
KPAQQDSTRAWYWKVTFFTRMVILTRVKMESRYRIHFGLHFTDGYGCSAISYVSFNHLSSSNEQTKFQRITDSI